MVKKVLVLLTVAFLLVLAVPHAVVAGSTAEVTIDATGSELDIGNTPSDFDFGTMSASETSETTGGYTTGYFTVTNDTSEAVDITIQATDMTGSPVTWTMAEDGIPASGTCGLNAAEEGAASFDIVVKKTGPFNDLVTGLAGGGTTQAWALELSSPTDTVGNNAVQGTVTLTASLTS